MKKYDEITHAKFSSIRDVFEPRTHKEEQPQGEKAVSQTSLTAQNLVPRSLFIFSRRNVLRRTLIKLTTSKRFEIFVSLLICLNCIVLGINDYNSANAQTWRDDVNIYSDPVFTALFTLEMILKIIAFGFILGKNTYLKDKWNWIDFVVVVTSLLSLFPQFGNYSAIRTFRLLRPLRSLNSLQNMKILVSTLLSSLAQLGEIIVFALFFFLIFAIMGVSLWSGSIHYRCRETQYPIDGDWIAVASDPKI